MRKPMKWLIGSVALVLVTLDWVACQISLTDMPGPPYPDRWGNNRWGVKYDPRIHGRGRGQQSAPSSSSGYWNGGRERDQPDDLPPSRYRGADSGPPPPPPAAGPSPSFRSKWIPGLKPLVSSLAKFRRRPRRPGPGPLSHFDRTSDMSYRNDLYARKSIDGYVQNYMNRYNYVSHSYPMSSDFVNIQNYLSPSQSSTPRSQFRPKNFERIGNKPSHLNIILRRSDEDSVEYDDSESKGSLKSSYLSLLPSTDTIDLAQSDSTLQPQRDFFQAQPQIDKKTSVSRNFAKTLSKLYNDYMPGGENSASRLNSGDSSSSSGITSSSSSSSSSGGNSKGSKKLPVSSSDDDDIGTSFSDDDLVDVTRRPSPPPKKPGVRPGTLGKRGPNFKERQYIGGGFGGPPPPPPPSMYGGSGPRPLSSLDMIEDDYMSGGSPYDSVEFSDSPSIMFSNVGGSSGSGFRGSSGFGGSSSFGGFSSSGSSVRSTPFMPGPPPASLFSSSFDSYQSERRPFSSSSSSSFDSSYRERPRSTSSPPEKYTAPVTQVIAQAPALTSVISQMPLATMTLTPSLLSSPFLNPSLLESPNTSSKKEKDKDSRPKPTKRKKNRLQSMLRGLLRHKDPHERRERERIYREKIRDEIEREKGKDSNKPAFAINVPLTVPAPIPQYSFINTVSSPVQTTTSAPPLPKESHHRAYEREYTRTQSYSPPPPPPPPSYSYSGRYPLPHLPPPHPPSQPSYSYYPPPPPPPPISPLMSFSPLSVGLSTLRDTLVGRERPPYYRYPPPPPPSYSRGPPPPPPSRLPSPSSTPSSDLFGSSDVKKESVATPGLITQHLQDWPRIFTAMGSSVDAVAGGIHAVRKEISKATGQTIAKGIMMSGSAVHEVSKGMAHVITKMAAI